MAEITVDVTPSPVHMMDSVGGATLEDSDLEVEPPSVKTAAPMVVQEPESPVSGIESPKVLNFSGLESELIGSEEKVEQDVLQTFKKVNILAAIRSRGDGGDRDQDSVYESDSDSPETYESDNEPSLLGEDLGIMRALSEGNLKRQKSDAPLEMPTIGIQQRYTLQRNDSLVNVYIQQLRAAEDDSDDASLEQHETVPEWITSLPTEKRSSILRFARTDADRSRAATTEELQEHYKLTEEQAEQVVELAEKELMKEAVTEKRFVNSSDDFICTIEHGMWKPVDASFEYPVFEQNKVHRQLMNLKISGEFFRKMRRGFTEKKMLVETELPSLTTWNEKTYKMFSFKAKNRVTNITEALVSSLQSTKILRDFLEYSCIILDEPVGSESKFVQYGDMQFGSRTFTLGSHSIVNARCLFNFTSQKFTFRDEVWNEVLETTYPGRQLMMEPVFVAAGVKHKIASSTKKFDSLQRLHNLFISDYIKSIQIVGFMNLRSRGKTHPLVFSFNDLYSGVDVEKKMKKPLKEAFGHICYCVNPDPVKHIPEMLQKYKTLERCRMMCDTVGWLHVLLYLLDQRICEVFRLDAAIRNWLAKKKPKTQNSKKKSKLRVAVEDLLTSINKERAQLNEMINDLPKKSQFEELYLEEDREQNKEMLRMAKNSTNASKRLSKGTKKNPAISALAGEHRTSKLDQVLFQKRQAQTKTGKTKKKKGFSLGLISPRKSLGGGAK